MTLSGEGRPQFNLVVNVSKFVRRKLVDIGFDQHIQFFLVPVFILPQYLIILGGFVIANFHFRGVSDFGLRGCGIMLLSDWCPRFKLLQLIRLKRLYNILRLILNSISLEIHGDRGRVKMVGGSVFLLVEI